MFSSRAGVTRRPPNACSASSSRSRGAHLVLLVTDKLKSYAAAKREIMPGVEHRQHKGLNNRAENSHQPTRPTSPAMRNHRTVGSQSAVCAEHEIGRELQAISRWLDGQRGLLGLVASDLRRHGIQETGGRRPI